jgi:hypothetical protein
MVLLLALVGINSCPGKYRLRANPHEVRNPFEIKTVTGSSAPPAAGGMPQLRQVVVVFGADVLSLSSPKIKGVI